MKSRSLHSAIAFVLVLLAGSFLLMIVREHRTISRLKSRILELSNGQGRVEVSSTSLSTSADASEEMTTLRRDAAEVYNLRNEMHAMKEADADLRRRINDFLRQISLTKIGTGEMTT